MAQTTNSPFPSPRIVGVVTSDMLAEKRYPEGVWRCDAAELRADGLSPETIIAASQAFSEEGQRRGFLGMTLFTLRLRRDGGAWDDARARERETFWTEWARKSVAPDWVDIEIEEAPKVDPEAWRTLRRGGIRVLLSHHAVAPEGPEAWEKALAAMRSMNPDAVKFAVAIPNRNAAAELLRFARGVAAEFSVSCVLGMGEAGRATRVLGPWFGCPMTYAFLGEGPVAPGQLSADKMRAFFAPAESVPAKDSPESEWLSWADGRMEGLGNAA